MKYVMYAPSTIMLPCARLMMFITPQIREKPIAMHA